MEEHSALTLEEWHKKSAVDLFNLVWSLLDNAERSPDQDDTMVHAAHASRFHWGEIGTPLEFERGEWQVMAVVDGRTELRTIEVGIMNDEDAQILSGITPEDQILAHPSRDVTPGMKVEVRSLS